MKATTVKFCLSQFRSDGDVEANVRRHVEVSRSAAQRGCDLVLFPELSLTGYEPTRARELALGVEDPRLGPLRGVSDGLGVTVVCGAPLAVATGVATGIEIALIVFEPGRAVASYAKQILHADEQPFFVAGTRRMQVHAGAHRIAPGICYESVQPAHVSAAVRDGATLYAASVAKPGGAMAKAHLHYAAMARLHRIPVVVSNAVGSNDGFVSGGRSAAWRPDGTLVASLGAAECGELMVEL